MDEVQTSQEMAEMQEINFDRYDAQLGKIAKGNTLSTFVMEALEKQYYRLKDIVSVF
jgi:hypothetical protein